MFHRLQASSTPRKVLAFVTALTTARDQRCAGLCSFQCSATRKTATPIQHLVVIFQENVSFDHYFGTYPVATNPHGEPSFHARPGTPTVNGLSTALANYNPNLNPTNGAGASNPFRFDRSQAVTSDQDHDYTAEQSAFDAGLLLVPA